MGVVFVTRHEGAREWARRRGLRVDRVVSHFDTDTVGPGDLVAGTLPVHLAAEVCERGARYLHLVFDPPADLRGSVLSADDLERLGARLGAYELRRVEAAG